MTTGEPTLASIWEVLTTILDPEFGVSIVDLGLIYSVECSAGNVHVVLTLTTPTCPAGAWIREGVLAALRQIAGVRDVRADLVFDPMWNVRMVTAEGRRQLGWSIGA